MATIRVTKEFNFEMAHALWNYDGSCRNIHGHSYKLNVTIYGEPVKEEINPKNGMVVDFGDLKRWVNETIVDELDHALMVSDKDNIEALKNNQLTDKLKIVKFQPTCENLLLYMVRILKNKLPGHVKLHSLKLRETESSYAEWYDADNPEN